MAGLFGGSTPSQPKLAPTPLQPDPQSPSVLESQRLATEQALARSGRSSTILSQGNQGNAATGDSYSSRKLAG